MAVNIYGSCTGTSASKYNVWLKVTQNSQNVTDNTSNVTVSLYLKRNDGYASSAYNLTESSNSAKLVVGGSTKVSKNLTIDTRNNITVTLASWTGNVSHNADGALSLLVNGSFSMSGTALSGGSVSGVYECTDIPRASVMTLSGTSINPGDSFTATISSASKDFSHKISVSLGDESKTVSVGAGITQSSITIPVSWANQVTSAKSATLSVVLTTYKSSKKIGSKTYSLKLTIPSTADYKPDFSLSVTRVDNGVPSAWKEYVAGISQVKLNISGLNLKYGATVSSYTATVGSVSKKSLPATFDLPLSGNITVSVTVKDSRGFSVKKSQTITSCEYSAPSLNIKSISRCDKDGNVLNSGTCLLVKYTLAYSEVNSKNAAALTVKHSLKSSGVYSGEASVESSPAIICRGELNETSSYTVAFTVKDGINTEGITYKRDVPCSAIPFNIRKGGKGAAFGCYAENENELSVAWDMNIQGQLNYENVAVSLTEKSAAVSTYSLIRHFPCLNLCFVRMRIQTATELAANTTHTLAVSEKKPILMTMLSVFINQSGEASASGGIKYETGEIFIKPNTKISSGQYVYISGFFLADYKE